MGSISAAIELQDNFTSVLMNIINVVNMSVSTMEQMQAAMNEPVDTASIQGMRDQMAQATAAARELDAAMAGISAPPAVSQDAAAPAVSRDRAPEPVTWQSYEGIEVFTGAGMERCGQEAASVDSMLDRLHDTQRQVMEQAGTIGVLSPQAVDDIREAQMRVQTLRDMVRQAEGTALELGTDEANARLERLRGQLDQTIALQENLNQAMQGADMGEINDAYLQLSQNISDAERMVRDSFVGIQPVEIPVTWNVDTLEVFTGTGMERFTQEAASANVMLETLNRTQAQIAVSASQTNLFPPGMAADMEGLQGRLLAVQSRIQAIESNPLNIGTDMANAGLEQLRSQLNQAVQEQENLNQAVSAMDVQAANAAYLRLSQTIGNTERYIRDNVDEQGQFNRAIEQGTGEANQLMQTIKGAVAAYATFQTVSNVLGLSDQMISTTARLDMMNDGLQTTQELQDMIFLSAERSRGAYQATADAVSKLGLMAGNAFSNSEEIIAFMEQVNKQFVIAGTEASGIDAAMLQLTQAMGSGVLRGEEYNSILEQAPNIIQNISRYIEENGDVLAAVAGAMDMEAADLAGNVQGHLKDIAGEGIISAEMVKAAMFYAAEETNAKFESMPMTFGQIWTSFENHALMAFQPVLERLNEIANSEGFQTFVNNAITGLSIVAGIALDIFGYLGAAAGVVADNWSWLSPIIYGVAAALAFYCGVMLVYNTIAGISAAVTAAKAFAEKVHTAALAMESGVTFMATAAQYGFNAALLACPVTWIIIAIIALIAIIYAVVAAVNHFAGTSVSATGIIAGLFATLGAHIINTFVVPVWNFFASLANFFANVFNDPVAAVKVLFYDMCLTVIGYIQNMAHAIENLINKIPGVTVDITSGLDGFYSKLEEAQQAVKDKAGWVEYFEKMDYVDYGKAWDAGYSFGQGIEEKIAGFDLASLFETNIPGPEEYEDLSGYSPGNYTPGAELAGIGSGIDDIAGNTGAIADAMDITQEELRYLRDIAEQEAVNRYTVAEVNIEQNNHNNIGSGMDLDGVVSGLTDAVNDAVDSITEGVHE
mgnify:FL=1